MKKTLLISMAIVLQISVYGQGTLSVNFDGIQKMVCQHPMMMPSGKWTPVYQNEEQTLNSEKITINEKTKELKVVINDGEIWVIKNFKKEIIKENDAEFGDVKRTIYNGTWTDNQESAKLIITKTINNGCITQLYSQHVINEETKLDYFKIVFTFLTNGACAK